MTLLQGFYMDYILKFRESDPSYSYDEDGLKSNNFSIFANGRFRPIWQKSRQNEEQMDM